MSCDLIGMKFLKHEQQSITRESRSVAAWGQGGMTGKEGQEADPQRGAGGRLTKSRRKCLNSNEYICHLRCLGGFMGVYICQNLCVIS